MSRNLIIVKETIIELGHEYTREEIEGYLASPDDLVAWFVEKDGFVLDYEVYVDTGEYFNFARGGAR